jgi:anaerobic selenocysteine-containing dehydrogenase
MRNPAAQCCLVEQDEQPNFLVRRVQHCQRREQFVMISRKNAAEHSIREGDPVLVYNDRGDLEGLARVTDTCGMA